MDIKFIKSNLSFIKDNQIKRFKDSKIVDVILEVDKQHATNEYFISKCNQLKKMMSIFTCKTKLSSNDNNDNNDNYDYDYIFETLYNMVKENKIQQDIMEYLDESKFTRSNYITMSKFINEKINETPINLLKERDRYINQLCNVLNENVPIDNNEDNNVIVITKDNSMIFPTILNKLNHVELANKLGIIDMETGSKIAGNRGYFLKGVGVRLNMALMTYAIDFLEKKNYTPNYTPHFMNPNIAGLLCQMEDYDDTLYKVYSDKTNFKYLIATSEQPLTGYYANKQFVNELPIKFAGLSTCYRKETGKRDHDNGIFRVHQFEKVEQLCIVEPENSETMLEEMIKTSQEFYDSLNISYRVVTIVSGQLNNSAAIKYDLEGLFISSEKYKELVSCSNCTDYFSKRLNIKNKYNKYVHILNSTLCANTRTICVILEQYQTETGIIIPMVLRKYMNDKEFIPFINN